jgi:sulfur relay (sulfurtransferase) complex TusBCD TusD component (DsrE family)
VSRHVALVVTSAVAGERGATALELAERLLARGHRVSVFAHGPGVGLTAGADDHAAAAAGLLRRGVHGGTLDWVVDEQAAARLGVQHTQAAGVIPGDHSDLWAFVRAADVVLSVGGGS